MADAGLRLMHHDSGCAESQSESLMPVPLTLASTLPMRSAFALACKMPTNDVRRYIWLDHEQLRASEPLAYQAAAGGVEDGAIRECADIVQQNQVTSLRGVRPRARSELLQLQVGAGWPDALCDKPVVMRDATRFPPSLTLSHEAVTRWRGSHGRGASNLLRPGGLWQCAGASSAVKCSALGRLVEAELSAVLRKRAGSMPRRLIACNAACRTGASCAGFVARAIKSG